MKERILSVLGLVGKQDTVPLNFSAEAGQILRIIDLEAPDYPALLMKMVSGEIPPESGAIMLQQAPVHELSQGKRKMLILDSRKARPSGKLKSYLIRNISGTDGYFARRRLTAQLIQNENLQAVAKLQAKTCDERTWLQMQYLCACRRTEPCILIQDILADEQLRELARKGKAVISVSEIERQLPLDESYLILSSGRFLQSGSGAEIRKRPANRPIADLFSEFEEMPGIVCGHTDSWLAVDVNGLMFYIRAAGKIETGSPVSVCIPHSAVSCFRTARADSVPAVYLADGVKLINGVVLHPESEEKIEKNQRCYIKFEQDALLAYTKEGLLC